MPRIVVCGIGTGGHYFPAVVVAQALQQRAFDVVAVVRRGHLEEKIARNFGLKTFFIHARPFYGKSMFSKLLFLFSLLGALYRLHGLTHGATAIAFGGFGAVPLLVSCIMNRSAYYIFESNRVPGRATRRFAHKAKKVFLGLPMTRELDGRSMLTGIPVRRDFKEKLTGLRRGKQKGKVNVLIYGGSQGARSLNNLAIELQALMPKKWYITVISGARDYDRVTQHLKARTRILSFAEKPWEEIMAADIIVSRAGALAGYEILCLNKKVVFVPFPYAIDNHQYYNAEYFARIGNAVVIDEGNLTAEKLMRELSVLLRRKQRKTALVLKDADERIADSIAGDLLNEEI